MKEAKKDNVEKCVEGVLPKQYYEAHGMCAGEPYYSYKDAQEMLAKAIRQGKLIIPREEDAEKVKHFCDCLSHWIHQGWLQDGKWRHIPEDFREHLEKQVRDMLLSFSPKPQTEDK